ncbi:MAG: rRNA pseudouridine synthase [Desulfomonile tiedjei]|uniref:Pseudouridine synthase n=1 Tax=Desulfomonile tiedjei TaxID=2358 RepID=A0A9D6V5V9_9BACT|nr:rRNA pseudouridine synthase [Desulfomonile tiedjei]
MPQKKIQLIIRDSGLASRRKAEELILHGRVTLNGQVMTDPTVSADPEKDHIKVDGKLLRPPDAVKSYFLFNKPRNVVSTMSDPEERPCLSDFLKPLKKRLFTVGRLDFDAEGLIILTNDGQLAQKLSHPSNKIPRTYLVKVRGTPDDRTLSAIRRGMSIGEGERIGEVSYLVIKRQKTTTWIKVTLFEGKKNEIKRIFNKIMHPVRKLRRVGFGPFKLGPLAVGTFRPFTEEETEKIEGLLKESSGKSSRANRTNTSGGDKKS